ncbi:MAG: hypothetical protein NVS3B20_04240 [Polyangiales bacterium]
MRSLLFPSVVVVSVTTAGLSGLMGCASSPPSASPPAMAPLAVAPAPPTSATAATHDDAPNAMTPSPEEKKRAARAQALREDRAQWEIDQKAELARWTPPMHAEAKALAEKSYADAKTALSATLAGKHRKPGNAELDKYRHPLEMLEFFGFKPTMTVVDVGPGEGWFTEVLAPALAKRGKYIATNSDPNGPVDERGTFYGQRFKAFLDTAPELYGKVQTVVVDSKAPKLGLDNSVDMVLLLRGVHGMKNNGTFAAWLAEIHRALKPAGVLGIEQHRAPPNANVDESAKMGYVPEKWVIEQAEAAGFKLGAKSEINANPKDTKDYPEGVWTLPPTLTLKSKDRERYLSIGESDRMTLKFVRVDAKP